MSYQTDRPPLSGRVRLVLVSLAALVAVGVAVGLLVSWLSTRALDVAGIEGPAGGRSAEPTDPATSPTGPTRSGPNRSDPTRTGPGNPGTTPAGQGSLVPSAEAVGSFEQVTLSGRFPGVAPGTDLQVERREGGTWVEFPVTATTDQTGAFSTVVELGQQGANVLRLTLPGSSRSTPAITVTVG